MTDLTPAEQAAEVDRLRAENTAIINDRDGLKRQIDWLAEWLTEHTDEPKGSYGAVEAAINAMAGFQRHIDRSAEVWAQNRQELEKLRAENTALAAKITAVHEIAEAWEHEDVSVGRDLFRALGVERDPLRDLGLDQDEESE